MSAEVIPFDKDAARSYPLSVERAWQAFTDAEQAYLAMKAEGATSRQLLDQSVRMFRAHRTFWKAMEILG